MALHAEKGQSVPPSAGDRARDGAQALVSAPLPLEAVGKHRDLVLDAAPLANQLRPDHRPVDHTLPCCFWVERIGKITASGKYKALDPAAVDGSEAAAGILYDAVDASAADAEGIAIVRLAEVNAAELIWPAGITAPQQATALGELAALNIIAR
jgi:hypothetical protein